MTTMSDAATLPLPPSQHDPRLFRVELEYSHRDDHDVKADHFDVLEMHIDFQLTMLSLLLRSGEKRHFPFETFHIHTLRVIRDE
jgi:hypothetical protein